MALPTKNCAGIGLDVAAIRGYFAAIQAFGQEARMSDDPRFLEEALRLMEKQTETARAFLGGTD